MYKMAGKIRGFFHAYIGQEAIAAGCMTATAPDDPFITAYRDHGLGGQVCRQTPVWPNCMARLRVVPKGKAAVCTFGLEHRFLAGMV